MLDLQEARQFYPDELSDADLMTLVSEIDSLQEQILDDLFGKAVIEE